MSLTTFICIDFSFGICRFYTWLKFDSLELRECMDTLGKVMWAVEVPCKSYLLRMSFHVSCLTAAVSSLLKLPLIISILFFTFSTNVSVSSFVQMVFLAAIWTSWIWRTYNLISRRSCRFLHNHNNLRVIWKWKQWNFIFNVEEFHKI